MKRSTHRYRIMGARYGRADHLRTTRYGRLSESVPTEGRREALAITGQLARSVPSAQGIRSWLCAAQKHQKPDRAEDGTPAPTRLLYLSRLCTAWAPSNSLIPAPWRAARAQQSSLLGQAVLR